MAKLLKIIVTGSIALFFSLIAFNNMADYGTNEWCVQRALNMNETADHQLDWRAIHNTTSQTLIYLGIIIVETVIALILWIALIMMVQKRHSLKGEKLAILGMTLGFLLFFVGFVTIASEWFYLWRDPILSGLQIKASLFSLVMLASLLLLEKRAY